MNFEIVTMTHNEAKTLPHLLKSLEGYRDAGGQITVMDASDDGTDTIARDFGCKVCDEPDDLALLITPTLAKEINKRFVLDGEDLIALRNQRVIDLAKARNTAAARASSDMVFMPDADEQVTAFDIDRICAAIDQGVDLCEYIFVHSHDPYGNRSCVFPHSKFYNRKKLRWSPESPVHEVLASIPGVKDGKHIRFSESELLLEHWTNPRPPSSSALLGLAVSRLQHPNNARNCHYFGRQLFYEGRWRSAIEQFEQHIAMDAWLPERSQSMVFMGDCYGLLKEDTTALDWYHRAFILDGTRREPLLKLAAHFFSRKELQRTVSYIAAALEIPWRDNYTNLQDYYRQVPHDMMYWALWHLGDKVRSKAHWEKCLEYQPQNPRYIKDAIWYGGYVNPGIEGWMADIELNWLYDNAKGKRTIVEIGSWKGRSTHALCSGAVETGTVTAVDHFGGSKGFDFEVEVHSVAIGDDDAVYKEFCKNMVGFKNLVVNRRSSAEAAAMYPDGTFDMAFIDAEHTKEGAKNDIRIWLPKVKPGGLLCGHDYCAVWPTVMEAVNEELGKVEVCGTIWFKKVSAAAEPIAVTPKVRKPQRVKS